MCLYNKCGCQNFYETSETKNSEGADNCTMENIQDDNKCAVTINGRSHRVVLSLISWI